jgi:predicted nucleic-acid-binding Zn-ribbon protein
MTEEENKSGRCAYCGSTDIDNGLIVTGSSRWPFDPSSRGGTFYRSSNADSVPVGFFCATCLNCGHMEFFVNPEQIKSQQEQYKKNREMK